MYGYKSVNKIPYIIQILHTDFHPYVIFVDNLSFFFVVIGISIIAVILCCISLQFY